MGILNELEGVVEVILGDLLAGGGSATAVSTSSSASINVGISDSGSGGSGNGGRLSSVLDVHRILLGAETEVCHHIPGEVHYIVLCDCYRLTIVSLPL